jgi:O-antigen/teichoic acid export membrane protein
MLNFKERQSFFLQRMRDYFPTGGLTPEDRSRLVKGIIYSFIIQGISVCLVFAGNYIVVKIFGASQYGIYVHIFNWISILTILALGGQDDVVLSLIPKYAAANDGAQIAAVIKHAQKRVIMTGLLASVLFLSLIYLFPVKTLTEHFAIFLVGVAAIYLSAFLTLNQTILQALNHVRWSQVIERLLKPFLFIVFVCGMAILHTVADAKQLVILTVINLVICAVAISVVVIKKVRGYFTSPVQQYKEKGMSRQAMYFFMISLLQLLSGKIGMLIMPWYTPEKDIGIFNISYRFADLVIYPSFLLHAVLPQLFARYHTASFSQKQALYSESTMLTLITALPLLLLNIVGGKWLLGYFGTEFTTGYLALLCISGSNFLSAIFGPANTILMMQGKEQYAAFSFLIYIVLLSILNVLFIPLWGITGAALAILTGNFIYNIVASWFVWRFTGVVAPLFRIFRKGGSRFRT